MIPTIKDQLKEVISKPDTELLKPKVDPTKVIANPVDVKRQFRKMMRELRLKQRKIRIQKMKELKKEMIKARRARAKYYIDLRKRRAAMRRGEKNLPPIKVPEIVKNQRNHNRNVMKKLRTKFREEK